MTSLQLPQWKLSTLGGAPAPKLTSYLGKPLLVLFYSIGCPGCKSRAIPYAKAWHQQYGADLHLIGVHTHFSRRAYSPQQIQEVNQVYQVPFKVYLDHGHAAADLFQADGTPHWALLDQKGQLIRSVFGSMPNAIHRIDYALTELFQKANLH
ncbi:MAG: TlpA disulfide reductase family protein [Bacteroidota bacterium]